MSTLDIDGVSIHLGDKALVALTHRVEASEILTIMGASGSGKSTFLNAIIGILGAEFSFRGDIRLAGHSLIGVPIPLRRVGIMFQDPVLFPHLSVGENLEFGVPSALGRDHRRAKVEDALKAAGLAGFADRDPATLSGGQKSRVALMRTILAEPRVLLLDEPFSKLDTDLRAQLRHFVFDLAREREIPTVLVTHDHEDALAAAGAVLSPLGERITL